MTKILRSIIGSLGGHKAKKSSDFSDFFSKSSAERTKVMRQVLREANEEQRKVVESARTV